MKKLIKVLRMIYNLKILCKIFYKNKYKFNSKDSRRIKLNYKNERKFVLIKE